MNDQENARNHSPFAELSFSEQQEMWRMWRAQKLDYQEIPKTPPAPPVEKAPVLPPAPQAYIPPSHKNLDRVHARIAAAAARAGNFKPLTPMG